VVADSLVLLCLAAIREFATFEKPQNKAVIVKDDTKAKAHQKM